MGWTARWRSSSSRRARGCKDERRLGGARGARPRALRRGRAGRRAGFAPGLSGPGGHAAGAPLARGGRRAHAHAPLCWRRWRPRRSFGRWTGSVGQPCGWPHCCTMWARPPAPGLRAGLGPCRTMVRPARVSCAPCSGGSTAWPGKHAGAGCGSSSARSYAITPRPRTSLRPRTLSGGSCASRPRASSCRFSACAC